MRIFNQLSSKIQNLLRQLNLKVTRMPGAIIFQHGMCQTQPIHGHIYVASTLPMERAIKIAFRCENPSGSQKFLPYVQEEIVHQARLAGFEPIYLSCITRDGRQLEREIDREFAIDHQLATI